MDFLASPQFLELINGTNGVLIIFIVFVVLLGYGFWQVVKFLVVSLKEVFATVNETLQEIKKEINNLSSKVEKLGELPSKVEVLSDRLETIENLTEIRNNRRNRR